MGRAAAYICKIRDRRKKKGIEGGKSTEGDGTSGEKRGKGGHALDARGRNIL